MATKNLRYASMSQSRMEIYAERLLLFAPFHGRSWALRSREAPPSQRCFGQRGSLDQCDIASNMIVVACQTCHADQPA